MTKGNKPYDTAPPLDPNIKFYIPNLMTKGNKPYDTTPRLDPSI